MGINKVVEFLIKLKSDATSAIVASKQVERSLNAVRRAALAAEASIKKAFSFKNFKDAITSIPMIKTLLNPYILMGTAIAASTTAVFNLGTAAEKTKVSFNTLLGSEEAAKKMLDQIGALDAKKVYGLSTVQEAAKQMLNFGVSSDKAITYLKQLGDIAGGDKQTLASLGTVFGQVTAAGRLTGGDLLQFINAGFNPLLELETMTGKKYSELRDLMEKGAITADHVAAAMQHATGEGGKFFNMTANQANTVTGKFEELKGMVVENATTVYNKLQPAISSILDLIKELAPMGMALGQQMMGFILDIVAWIVKWKDELFFLGKVAFSVSSVMIHMTILLINYVKDLIDGIGDLAGAFGKLFEGDWEGGLELANNSVLKVTGIKSVADTVESLGSTLEGIWAENKSSEQKQTNEVSTPGLVGSLVFDEGGKKESGKKGSGGGGKKLASEIATGGSRNTAITMNISKFFDSINVHMIDSTDTNELERVIVETMNRALAVATSADR